MAKKLKIKVNPMEKESKHFGKIYKGLIIAVISLIGIFFTIIYPYAYNPIQLILCVVFVVGIIILTKGLIENKSEKIYWLPFLSAGILTILSMFTPESYNNLVDELLGMPDTSWLWDLKFASDFQLIEVFYLVLVLIAVGGILFISVKSYIKFESIIKYSRFLRTLANFLIVSPVCFFAGKTPPVVVLYYIPGIFTTGFALVGPFFMGLLIKFEVRIFQKNLEFPQNEFQIKRNKVGYAYTIVGGYLLIILSVLIDTISFLLFPILPLGLVDFILIYNQTVVIITVLLAFISIFCALLYPRCGVILLMVTGIIIAITALLVSWLYILIVFLIVPDLHKTRKLAKLAKNQ